MKRLLKEPLLHFLILGAAIFAAYNLVSRSNGPQPGQIFVTQGQIEHLATGFAKTWQRPPTAEELEGLIRDRVREEVYCREAVALGLDKDDTVVRRRLRQKMEFLTEDIAAQAEPTDNELNAYLEAHAAPFRLERQFTFSQVYLNPERHGENLARDIAQLLARLRQAGDKDNIAELGDPFLLEYKFESLPASELVKQFGEKFAMELGKLAPGEWQGPVESGYGTHLVFIERRTEGRVPALAEVRDAVRREWANTRRLEANEKFFQSLLQRYVVTVEKPEQDKAEQKLARVE